MSVNKVILIGRLGQNPETRFTGGGQAVCNFSMATDEKFKDKNGEKKEQTTWHKIVIWGKQAEIAQQYLHKGSLVFVEGKIQSREYEKDGVKKTSYEINAGNFRMLDKRNQDEEFAGAAVGAGRSQNEQEEDSAPF